MCNKYDNLFEMSRQMSKEEKEKLVRQILQNFSAGMQADDQRKLMHLVPRIAGSMADFTDLLPKMMIAGTNIEDKKDLMRRLMEKFSPDVAMKKMRYPR